MIVRIDFRAGHDIESGTAIDGSRRRPVDEHLDGDACGGIEAFHLRWPAGPRQLRFIEMADRLTCAPPSAAPMFGDLAAHEERIVAVLGGTRLRSLHLQPARGPLTRVAPRVRCAR